jgi:hypothetical protein
LLTCEVRDTADLALRAARLTADIHTGDFGFYDDRSLDRIADKYVNLPHAAHAPAVPRGG